MDTDALAEKLVSGEESCSSCSVLNDTIQKVRNGELSMEEFKAILRNAKEQRLQEISH